MTEADKSIFHKFLNTFREIPPPDLELISQYFQYRKISEGEVLLPEGRTAKELFFVLDGILKIVSTSQKGNAVVQFFIKENKFCTILYSFNADIVSNEGIVAATDGAVLQVAKTKLTELYERLPYFRDLVERITQKTLIEKIQFRNKLMGEEAAVRYHTFISQQSDIMLRVPLSDVASYLGITRQSLSRIRRNRSL